MYIISDGANKPYRLKIRAPGFAHLQGMDEMARGHMLADVAAAFETARMVTVTGPGGAGSGQAEDVQ